MEERETSPHYFFNNISQNSNKLNSILRFGLKKFVQNIEHPFYRKERSEIKFKNKD